MSNKSLKFNPNTLYHGDCLEVMESWRDACIDLIYLDPPFNSNANYNILYGKDSAGKARDEQAQFTAFKDTWFWSAEADKRVQEIKRATGHPAQKAIKGLAEIVPETGMLSYLVYMADRIAAMHRVLKETGSFYLHCDQTAAHYLKILLDEIFDAKNFRNEIIWYYFKPHSGKSSYPKNHDTIFFYTKSKKYSFNHEATLFDYDEKSIKRYDKTDKDGKKYKMYYGKDGVQRVAYLKSGRSDNVFKIPFIQGTSKERLGYPTQKPLALLERIIKVSSDEGDIVLDPFCGCGTTAEASYQLDRKFIGIDISPYAITRICRDRLKNAEGVSIQGLPTDMKTARDMAKDDPFYFEQWAVTTLPGFEPNDKQVADGGIDGRGFMLHPPDDEAGQCVVQVKGGGYTPDSLRALLSKITGGSASLGIFITVNKMNDTPTAKECIAAAGQFNEGAKTFNRMMFWSMEEHFANAKLQLPAMAHPRTGKALHDTIPSD